MNSADSEALLDRFCQLTGSTRDDSLHECYKKTITVIYDLHEQIRQLKESKVHAHLPLIDREIGRLEKASELAGLDSKDTQRLDTLIKLKHFIYEKPTGLSKGSGVERLSEDSLIHALSASNNVGDDETT